jgi:hypothetical protein
MGRRLLEDLHIDGKVMLQLALSHHRPIGWENVDWIYLAQDRDVWCDSANVMTFSSLEV